MTEEIQKRIEAIKAGKVPDGYKKAVVGIVPSEWQEKRLSDLLKFQNGVNAEKEKFNSGIKMISVMDILDERPIVYDAIRGQVDIDEKALNNYSVTYGDILFKEVPKLWKMPENQMFIWIGTKPQHIVVSSSEERKLQTMIPFI